MQRGSELEQSTSEAGCEALSMCRVSPSVFNADKPRYSHALRPQRMFGVSCAPPLGLAGATDLRHCRQCPYKSTFEPARCQHIRSSHRSNASNSSPNEPNPSILLSTMCTLVAVFLAAVISVVAAAPSGLLAPGAALAGPILGPAALAGPILGPSALAGPQVGPARISGAVDGGAVVTGAVAGPSLVSGSVAGHGGWPALAGHGGWPALAAPWGAVLSGPLSPAAALAGPITAPALIAGPSGSIAAGAAGVGSILRAGAHHW